MRRVRPATVAAAALGLLASAAPLGAAEPDVRARAAQSFREGQAAYDRHEYSSAAAAFDLAAGFEPRAVSLLDAADAWTRAGEPVRAADDCDRALAMAELTAAEQSYGRQLLEKIKNEVATIQVVGAATTYLTMDGGEEQRLPVHKRVAPGRHAIDFRDVVTGSHVRREVELRGGDTVEVRAPVEARAVDEPAQPPRLPPPPPAMGNGSGARVPALAWVSFGVSAAAVGVTSVFGVLTLNAQSKYNSNATEGSHTEFYRDRAITNVALGVAVAGLTAGLVLWVVSGVSHARPKVGALLPRSPLVF